MKKFRFRLERMLQLKAHREKEKQKLLGAATQKVVNQETALELIGENRRVAQSRQRPHLQGRINTSMMTMYSRYYLQLKKDDLAGHELLNAFEKEREDKRQDLVEATKEKKIYEKLKERRLEAYYKEYKLASQKEQDEVASQMLTHKKSSRASRELSDDRS